MLKFRTNEISWQGAITALLGTAVVLIGLALLLSPKPWFIDLSEVEGDDIRTFARFGLWWGGAALLTMLIPLLVTVKWWIRPLPSTAICRNTGHAASSIPTPRWSRALVYAAMVVFAIQGAIRLPQSLWDDEAYCVRKMTLGTYHVENDGRIKIKSVPWTHTLWYYEMPANHGLQTILSRLSHDTWRVVTRPGGLQLCEPALRMPSYLAGILAIGATALWLARMNFPWAGVLAAWLLALHPWYLKLVPEARGYAFVFLLVPTLCILAPRAAAQGTWRAMAWFAAAELALLYTWPGALLTVLFLNAAVAVLIFHRASSREEVEVVTGRWLACGVFAAMALVPLTAPWLPQLARYLGNPLRYDFGLLWLRNFVAYMVSGIQWSETGSPDPHHWELCTVVSSPFLFAAGVTGLLILAVIGAIRMARAGISSAVLVPVLVLPGPILYAVTKLKHGHLHEWYLAFMLPGLAALIALGAIGILRRLAARPLAVGLAISGVVGFGLWTMPARMLYLNQSLEPFRESVRIARPHLDPSLPENRHIITTSCLMLPVFYDPMELKAFTGADLQKLMQKADAEGSVLYANNGYLNGVQDRYPEIYALLTNKKLFDEVANLRGAEPCHDRIVHRYRPGSFSP
jgi:hypothetical protein